MSTDAPDSDATTLAPDDAFRVLGNGTRMEILRALGRTEDPLSFSELHDRVGTRDSGQFNYHLDKLVDHFVSKTDDGYELQPAGRRVIEAVLSGAVTEDPVLERTRIDHSCHYCGGPLEMEYRQESTATFCTECGGAFDRSTLPDDLTDSAEPDGFVGYLHLPPAGLKNRSPTEVHAAAFSWQMSEVLPTAGGVCPRCSAPVDKSVQVCEDHDARESPCAQCGNRHAVQYRARCTNCIFVQAGPFVLDLLGTTDLLAFLTARGMNPITPSPERFGSVVLNYEEEVFGTDPFEARFTFHVDGDTLALTVDDALTVTDVASPE